MQATAASNTATLNPRLVKYTIEETFHKGFEDFHFFSYLVLAEVILYQLPALYISIWLMLVKAHSAEERARILRFALALPRGFAKTTFIKLLVCWFIVYDKATFCLVVCSTENLAHNFTADVDEMLSTPDVERVYGNWAANKAVDSKELKKCSYRRRVVIIAAIGSGTSVRGLNLRHQRPDFVICDDMQTKENADSDTESNRLLEWFMGTLLKAVSPFFAIVIYIGNMYIKNCILLKLKENPYWISLVTGCILEDGKSLWEELHPVEALYEEYKHDESMGLAHIWFAEKQNEPIATSVSLLPDGRVPPSPYTLEELVPEAGFAVIDPAGMKKASDDNVVVFFYVQDGIPYAVKAENGNFTPQELIQLTISIAAALNIRVIFVEDVAYQSTLIFWFNTLLQQSGYAGHFIIQPINPGNRAKEGRIRVSSNELIGIDRENRPIKPQWYIADVELRQKYVFQALSYKIGKPNNRDDILDTCAYVPLIRAQYWDMIYNYPLSTPAENTAHVVGHVKNAPF